MTAAPTKELPHDLLAEKSLIGSLLIDGDSFDQVSNIGLSREDFYHPQYGIIFEIVRDLSFNSEPIDLVTVCAKLADRGKLEVVGGQTGVLTIIEDQVSSANIVAYAKVVKEKALIRNVIRTAVKVVEMGTNFSGESKDFISEVEAKFFQLTSQSKTGGLKDIKSFLKQNLKDLENSERERGDISGLPTGFKELDKKLLGLQAGQLIILAARPAMGKTSLALNMAVNSVRATGLPVSIFSLEMVSSELTMRILSSEASVDSQRLRTKNLLDTDLRSIGVAVKELSNLPIYIDDKGDINLVDIKSQCRKIKMDQGLGLVIIDYLQLMHSHTGGNTQREQQIAEISRGLKNLAKELECPIMALSQLNRAVEARVDKRPGLADLRESGSIEQDADIVLFVYRDEVYNKDSKDKGIAEIIVGKNRAGETGTAKVAWIASQTKFANLNFDPNP
ncbi:MAG: replicative DNA helicase [Bacteriovoracaceae bacterium]